MLSGNAESFPDLRSLMNGQLTCPYKHLHLIQ